MTPFHWLKSYGTISPTIDLATDLTLLHLLENALSKYASLIAVHSCGLKFTYQEIDQSAAAFSAYLQKSGVSKGAKVAVMLPNIAAFYISLIGILRVGATQVNINPLYTSNEINYLLKDAQCEILITYKESIMPVMQAMDGTSIRQIIVASQTDGFIPSNLLDILATKQEYDFESHKMRCDITNFNQALKDGFAFLNSSFSLLNKPTIQPDDLVFLQYTGGTTGQSKGAELSHQNLLANITQFKSFMPNALLEGQEILVTAIPLYHIFALMISLTYFLVGAQNWLVDDPRKLNDFISILKQARPTIFMGVNTLFSNLLQHPQISEIDWSRLKLPVGGGSAIFPSVSQRWQQVTGCFIYQGYGLSETSPVVSFNPSDIEHFNGTVGLPMPSTDVVLKNDEGENVPIGQPGEICVKGPQVMRGYWRNEAANASAFTEDGYFKTGDIGIFDEKGFLSIVDRKKDMIIVSGFNVYPNQIEAVVSAHHAILECACVGVADEKTGEALKLFIVKREQATLTSEEIIAHCRLHLTSYKVPKYIQFIQSLPKSSVGKILRKDLR